MSDCQLETEKFYMGVKEGRGTLEKSFPGTWLWQVLPSLVCLLTTLEGKDKHRPQVESDKPLLFESPSDIALDTEADWASKAPKTTWPWSSLVLRKHMDEQPAWRVCLCPFLTLRAFRFPQCFWHFLSPETGWREHAKYSFFYCFSGHSHRQDNSSYCANI